MTEAAAVSAKVRELHAAAKSSEYEDPIFGALVIAATALLRLEEEMQDARHPRGKAGAGRLD